jgi:hypothetical protein
MEPRSWAAVDVVEEFGEELSAVVLVVVGGVVALLAEDGHELRSGVEVGIPPKRGGIPYEEW